MEFRLAFFGIEREYCGRKIVGENCTGESSHQGCRRAKARLMSVFEADAKVKELMVCIGGNSFGGGVGVVIFVS